MYFVLISEQTVIIPLYSINLVVFITKAESVYKAVRAGSLNQTDKISSLKYQIIFSSHRAVSQLLTLEVFRASVYKL
jgi:hypothetical protein